MNLKKTLLLAAIVCGTAISMQAQNTKHEIGISFGAGANSTFFSSLEDLTTITSTAGAIRYGDSKHLGPIAAEYFYHISSKFSVGGIANYVRSKKDLYIAGSTEGDAKVNFITVMPAGKYEWIQKNHFGMYTKWGIGVTFRHEKQSCRGAKDFCENDVLLNFQISLLGLEGGSQHLRVFGELGCGEQGIALIGLRYKL